MLVVRWRALARCSCGGLLVLAVVAGSGEAYAPGAELSVGATRSRPCSKAPGPVPHRRAPTVVTSWTAGERVVGRGSIWTIRSALDEQGVKLPDGTYSIKFPWYVLPPGGKLTITGRRLDGPGTFRADANVASEGSKVFATSSLEFSTWGCWQISGRYRGSTLTFRMNVHPQAVCSDSIYAGTDAARVVRQPSDLVVGPVRFATLVDAERGTGTRQISGRRLLGYKSPLTVSGTDAPSVTVQIHTSDDSARIVYDRASNDALRVGSFAFASRPDAVVLQTGLICGDGPAGFVQYAGGFLATHPVCLDVEVRGADGRSLGKGRVGLDRGSC